MPASEIDLSSPLSYGTPSSRIGLPTAKSGSTPIRPRTDIGTAGRLREVNLTTGAADAVVSSYGWGGGYGRGGGGGGGGMEGEGVEAGGDGGGGYGREEVVGEECHNSPSEHSGLFE